MPPVGGVRSSLAGMIATLTNPIRRTRQPNSKSDPSGGKGAPIMSYSWGNSGGGWGIGNNPDITQFAPVFQPSGGMFAPGYPLVPVERERVRVRDFPVGYNYVYTPRAYEPIGFEELRGLAENHDITRLCIETRKDQVEQLNWTIGTVDGNDPGPMYEERVKELTTFWRKPDGVLPFGTWLRKALEDLLVLDAPTFEVRRNRGGRIIGLDIIDGATIKVLIDDTGRTPVPPAPAYEQVIHGRPWVLTEDGRTNTTTRGKPLFGDQIIYLPRNPRPHKSYGFSPVEQTVMTVNTGLRRQLQQLQYFTEGNVPRGTVDAPAGATTEQIAQYQQWFDSVLAGNTAERTKLIWLPPGSKYRALLETPYKDMFDEWLARIVCFAFSLPPNAFVERINRATAQTAQEAALQEGLAPLMAWIKRLIDGVIQDRMGQKDLEFQWSQQSSLDPEVQAKILKDYVQGGIYSINNALDTLGMDAIEGGDERFLITTGGPILLSAVLAGGTPGGESQLPPGKPLVMPAPPTEKAATLTKENARYTARSKVSDKCGDCSMFRPPDACTLVRGVIAPSGWCRYFDRKTSLDITDRQALMLRLLAKGHVDPANAISVTLPLPNAVTHADVQHTSWSMVRSGDYVAADRMVPIAGLTATQSVVDVNRVADEAARFRDEGQGDFRPLVLDHDGMYLLVGHHHVEAAKRAGFDQLAMCVMHK